MDDLRRRYRQRLGCKEEGGNVTCLQSIASMLLLRLKRPQRNLRYMAHLRHSLQEICVFKANGLDLKKIEGGGKIAQNLGSRPVAKKDQSFAESLRGSIMQTSFKYKIIDIDVSTF